MTPEKPTARVLYCESNMDGTIGGSHYCLLWLVENLDRTQFTPLVTFYEDHALVPRFRAAAETLIIPPRDPVTWGAGIRGLIGLPLGLVRRAVNAVRFAGRVMGFVSFLREHQIALVHQNNSIKRHHDWMLAALLAGVPYVAHERGINHSFSWLDRFLGERAALIIPMSKSIMGFMVAAGVPPGNIRVLYDGLDPERVKPARTAEALRREYGVRPDQPIIGIVGNIRVWKGQETVVRALIELLEAQPDVVCFFVGASTPGDRPYREQLDALIAGAGIADHVRFTGYQADPASFVNMMDVVIHASVEPEPFGMVVLEAMAQRKPIVGSRAGGVVEMVIDGETGYTFPPGDAAELASRLRELLGDREKAVRMGQAGYQRLVDAFSIPQYMHGITSVYRAALAHEPVPARIGIPYEESPTRGLRPTT
ncbi:MAG: glycosyltransferase family 4 protein [Vicinamibacterales bacterium]